MGQEEFQEVSSFLKRFIRRFKFLKGVEGVCLTAICALLLFAVGPGVEQIKYFLPYAPLVYSVITGATLLGLIVWTVVQLSRRFSQEHAARYIEQKQPKLRNNLINDLLETGRVKSSLRLFALLFIPVIAMVLFNPSWVGQTYSLLTHPFSHLP